MIKSNFIYYCFLLVLFCSCNQTKENNRKPGPFLKKEVAGTVNKSSEADKPNVIFILTDDQGWGDLSVHGNLNVNTPNIDQLALEGALFDRFYVAPVCAPTRAGLLTGRYHSRTGVYGVSQGKEFMNPDEVTIADLFKSSGYDTGCFGKWHNGSQYPYHPNARGFNEFYGFCSGHWANYFNTTLENNGREVKSEGYLTDDLTDKALAFIAKNKDNPFFCYIPYNTPHSPFQVPDEYFDRVKKRGLKLFNRDLSKEEVDKTISALAMCENIDWNVGRLLDKVEELGLKENTIVVYITDNGPNSWRWNDDMKGRKGAVDEGGIRVPCIIRWPGHIKGNTVITEISNYTDILPTLADFAGVSTKNCKPLDGMSLKPLLEGKADHWPDRLIFTTYSNRLSIRTQQYRADKDGLYDMIADPGQRKNIAAEKPEIHKYLADTLVKWNEEVTRNIDSIRWHPVGYREFPLTVLPAQDSKLHKVEGKGITYSSIHPNSSWITGWTDMKAYPAWDIDIHTAGRYEVTALYACAQTDVGTEIELTFKDKRLKGKINKSHDPSLIHSRDRVERQESYEKEFKPLKLGIIELPKEKGEIRLKALSKPGRQVMELKSIKLKLL